MERYAILLVRVSTLIQDFEAQIYDLKQYGISLGYTHFHVVSTKETAFADLNQKVGTNDMFHYIKDNPEYNTILTTEISRLARRQSVLHQIKEHCINHKIQIFIKDINFRLLDDDGKINANAEMTFTLYGMFAESEVKQKLERFSRKRKELMAMGISVSGKLLFGYDRKKIDSKKNTLVINDEQANIIRTIFNWYLNGLFSQKNPSIKAISIECVKRGFHKYTHSKRNVNKLLKEEGYTGNKTTNNKRKNPKFGIVTGEDKYLISSTQIKYPVIIESELFQQVQNKLKTNSTQGDKETKHVSILAKLLNCPSCGRKLQGNYRKTLSLNRDSYRCTSRGDTVSCASVGKSFPMNLIDSAVWISIKTDLPALSKKISEINPDIYLFEIDNHLLNLKNREIEIKDEIDNHLQIIKSMGKLTSSSVIELVTTTGKKIEKLEKDLNKIEQEKSKLESNKLMISDKQTNVESVINDNLSTIESSKEQLKTYINHFVEDINVVQHNKQYTILELLIKDSSVFASLSNPDVFSQRYGKNTEVHYVMINKIVTRQPKISIMVSRGANDIEHFRNEIIPMRLPKIEKWNELKRLNYN